MAVRISFPEPPLVSRLPKNSIKSISGAGGFSAAAADSGSASATTAISGLTGILIAFKPFVEFQLGKEIRVLMRRQQFHVAHSGLHGIAIRGREPQQPGHGERDASGGEAAHR